MPKESNSCKGRVGEKIAETYLKNKGYKIIKKNYQTRYGEIDLICTHKETLIFAEVKLKVGDNYGTPEEMINQRKVNQIRKTAEYYLLTNKSGVNDYGIMRIDAVAIVVGKQGDIKRINHYENIEL